VHRDGEGKQIVFKAKDEHAHLEEHATPLQRSAFERIEVDVPTAPEKLLAQEYSEGALMARVFREYGFGGSQQWIAIRSTTQYEEPAMCI
jgi:hypothetical protein